MSVSAVEIKNLEFAYTPGVPVLEIESFKVRAGEHVFIHGPSGCGKTTLLGLITGVLGHQKGLLQILGQNCSELKGAKRDAFRGAHIGYIFQMFNLIPYLSVRENIYLPCSLSEKRRQKAEKFDENWLDNLAFGLGIESLLSKSVTELSVGQQQRVAAARALAGRPEIVIADEPTSALDYDRRKDFIRVLFEQADRSETTILFVSHDHTLSELFHRSVSLPDLNRANRSVK